MVLKFAPSVEMEKIKRLADEFFTNVLINDEESFFISDEATAWDVCMSSTAEELIQRISSYYKQSVTLDDFKQPLWKLLHQLDAGRRLEARSSPLHRFFHAIKRRL